MAGAVLLAVNGTLMRGLELNGNLLKAGARFVREARTSARYRLFSIVVHPSTHPARKEYRTDCERVDVVVRLCSHRHIGSTMSTTRASTSSTCSTAL